MPETPALAPWKLAVGYVAFGLFAFVFWFYLTFPYDAVRERLRTEAEAAGYSVTLGSLGPGLRGLTATNVQISKKTDGDHLGEPLVVKRLSFRPSLIPLGVAFGGSALNGSVGGGVGGLRTRTVRLDFSGLDLSQGNLKAFSGVDLSGKASGSLSLDLPSSGTGAAAQPDLALASGHLDLDIDGLVVNGGTVKVTIPMYGPDPTPVDLPKITLGDVAGKVKFDKGTGTIEQFTDKGPGLDLNASGTVKLARKLDYSEPNVELRLKTEPEFVKSLGVYGVGLSQLKPDPKDPSWRLARLSGYLGRPSFR